MHRFTDPDAGDGLLVVTAPVAGSGVLSMRQDFVELSLLESDHGVACIRTPMTSGPSCNRPRSCSAGPAG